MAKSILIINEDEEEIKELQDFFTAEGSTVFCVKTVDDAITCFANNDLCLIILDVDISVEDDHRLLRVMRKSKNTPILVLSSQSEYKHRLETLKAGTHAYMCPPYSLEEFLARREVIYLVYILRLRRLILMKFQVILLLKKVLMQEVLLKYMLR